MQFAVIMVCWSCWSHLLVEWFSLDFVGVMARWLSSLRKKIRRCRIPKWVSDHCGIDDKHSISFRLDRQCRSKFWWSSCTFDSILCASIWFSNIIRCFVDHLCSLSLVFVDGSQSSLASINLFTSLWICQYCDLHSRNINLWSVLSRWSTSTTYLSDVHYFRGFSRWLSHHECIDFLFDWRQRLAIHEETCGHYWITHHLCTWTILYHEMFTEFIGRLSISLRTANFE